MTGLLSALSACMCFVFLVQAWTGDASDRWGFIIIGGVFSGLGLALGRWA